MLLRELGASQKKAAAQIEYESDAAARISLGSKISAAARGVRNKATAHDVGNKAAAHDVGNKATAHDVGMEKKKKWKAGPQQCGPVNPLGWAIRVCARPQCDKGIWVILAEVGAGCVATRVVRHARDKLII